MQNIFNDSDYNYDLQLEKLTLTSDTEERARVTEKKTERVRRQAKEANKDRQHWVVFYLSFAVCFFPVAFQASSFPNNMMPNIFQTDKNKWRTVNYTWKSYVNY